MARHPAFERVAAVVDGIPNMSRHQGERVFDHITRHDVHDILEIGPARGTSAAYMAAGLEANGGGHLTTLEKSGAKYDPRPTDTWERAGVADMIELVLREEQSYNWWLGDQVAAQTDADGNVTPLYDFCYLDGAHHYTIDGLAVVYVERLLRPGGWLLLDDLRWSYATGESKLKEQLSWTEAELTEPHVARVLETVIKPHPEFGDIRVEDEDWVWVQKSKEPRRVTTIRTTPLSERVRQHARKARRTLSQR